MSKYYVVSMCYEDANDLTHLLLLGSVLNCLGRYVTVGLNESRNENGELV